MGVANHNKQWEMPEEWKQALSQVNDWHESVEAIFQEIREERFRQVEQWGGAEFDDEQSALDFFAYIHKQRFKGSESATRGNIADTRERFIKIAALAVAAVESIDRKEGKKFPDAPEGQVGRLGY